MAQLAKIVILFFFFCVCENNEILKQSLVTPWLGKTSRKCKIVFRLPASLCKLTRKQLEHTDLLHENI